MKITPVDKEFVYKGSMIITQTDLKGIITYVNKKFCEVSWYSPDEIVGETHNILRHPDMPKAVFQKLWETMKATNKWQGFVKNLRKDNSYYWVHAIISGVFKDGKLVEYKSLRTPITVKQKSEAQSLSDQIKKDTNDTIRTISYI